MSLVVDRIKCVEESDEAGSDDVYLVVFRGNATAPFESNVASVGPEPAWTNFDTDDVRNTDVKLAQTRSDAVYAVQLVEEDNSKDITGEEILGVYKAQTSTAWRAAMLSFAVRGQPTNTETAKASGYAAVSSALLGLGSLYMSFPLGGNDDSLRVRRVTITEPGQSQQINFRSNEEDATYYITFKHT